LAALAVLFLNPASRLRGSFENALGNFMFLVSFPAKYLCNRAEIHLHDENRLSGVLVDEEASESFENKDT